MAAINFNQWMLNGKPGSKYVYHVGFLATVPNKARLEARKAWQAYVDGYVDLVQERIDVGQYLYMAVKRRVRRKI